MCGIFGVTLTPASPFTDTDIETTVRDLFRLSESRGKEAAGIAVQSPDRIRVYKEAVTASALMRTDAYRGLLRDALAATRPSTGENGSAGNGSGRGPLAVVGHSRLVTNGAQGRHENNQPVIADATVAVHNGIIVNDADLWGRHTDLCRKADVDTEVLLALLERHQRETGSWTQAARRAFEEIEGTASVAILFKDHNVLLLATNNGSLYYCANRERSALFFASERDMLMRLAEKRQLRGHIQDADILQLRSNTALLVSLDALQLERFALDADDAPDRTGIVTNGIHRQIENLPPAYDADSRHITRIVATPRARTSASDAVIHELVEAGIAQVPELERCSRCVLTRAMPFIEFDDNGVCNFCRNYRKIEHHGPEALADHVERFRRTDGLPDALLSLSGGRDSTYSLHYFKSVLGLNVLTYTYDWGMVTDIARRNIARLCGKLGVEHILVSADINRKREYIRMNVNAWLKRPDLGTVPLFMAGDKQFFYHANRLRKQLNIPLTIFSMNPMERTEFKAGFCGVTRGGSHDRFYGLTNWNKVKIAWHYGKQYLLNPAYINRSLVDTVGAYFSYYVIPHDYLQFFEYVPWDEETINRTLIDEYGWETASDTKSTWRIGDGTAAFYNYIYYVGAGFTENDTFRSNQIREGVLDRETALENVRRENRPRMDTLHWYCDTIGIDLEHALRTINAMPKWWAKFT